MARSGPCLQLYQSRFFLASLLLLLASVPSAGNVGTEEIEPSQVVLFPSFSLIIGVIVFWLLSRHLNVLPNTAIMFLIGTAMGIAAELRYNNVDNLLNQSIQLWSYINSTVLLLVFLPGLIFRDAYSLDVYIFVIALVQCLVFAFPMVLAGTSLTALVAYYIFPYGWSFNLAMTFGSILSATDPVAVAALLEQIGAPPRLKVHISGESLLNDGSAIVFFEIFSLRYLTELGIPGVGEEIDFAKGVGIFFRKALGSVATGIFFGVGLLVLLHILNRRFNREENVMQVLATIAVAYAGYYVAEIVWGTSGVLSTLTTGAIVKFLGRAMVNDAKLLDDFWALVEQLLNTLLFVLGGTVWGAVIANEQTFGASDWGYMILLYVLLTAIRMFLFAATFPVTSRIGLKTCWPETFFQVHAGLRGAVGIALAISLDNEVRQATSGASNEFTEQTQKIFGFVGGVAFLTLVINGTTAGPLLRWLHLTDSSETRKKILKAYQTQIKTAVELVRLLTQPRFRNVNYAVVKHHVPFLKDLTRAQLMEAVEKHKYTTPPEDYQPPHLEQILPFLPEGKDDPVKCLSLMAATIREDDDREFEPEFHAQGVHRVMGTTKQRKQRLLSTIRMMIDDNEDAFSLQEFRCLFLSLLRAAYAIQVNHGELEDREVLVVALETSLDFAADDVANGKPLGDWDYIHLFDSSLTAFGKIKISVIKSLRSIFGKRAFYCGVADDVQRLTIERSIAFMAAHQWAQSFMQKEFEDNGCELSELGKKVLKESQAQCQKAEAVLDEFSSDDVAVVLSRKCCLILLNSSISFIEKLVEYGQLKKQEAEHLVEEIQETIDEVLLFNGINRASEISTQADEPKA